MALHLNARQRAMLQEMHITVWMAPCAQHTPQPSPQNSSSPLSATAPAPAPIPTSTSTPTPSITNTPTAHAAPPARKRAKEGVKMPPARTAATQQAQQPTPPRLGPVWAAYPQVASSATNGVIAARWLVVSECLPPHDTSLHSEAGQLLDNMLRALRLQYNPHVFITSVVHPDSSHALTGHTEHEGVQGEACVQQVAPAIVLALGPLAARALMGGHAHLGQLRARVQHCARTPMVVTYPLSYLLRHPQTKAAAWADLCRAYACIHPPTLSTLGT